MIKERKQLIDDGELESAIEIFEDANEQVRWKDLYGGTILSCLGKHLKLNLNSSSDCNERECDNIKVIRWGVQRVVWRI